MANAPTADRRSTFTDVDDVNPRDPNLPDRRYRMMRIETGDYLLLSNDLQTLWRITVFEDEEVTKGGGYRNITVWGLSSRPYPKPFDDVDLADWDGWHDYWYGHRTRKEAIHAAMTSDPSRHGGRGVCSLESHDAAQPPQAIQHQPSK